LESLERVKPAVNRTTTQRSDDSEYETLHTPIHMSQRSKTSNKNNNNMLQLRQELVKKIQARRTKIDPDVL